MFKVDAIIRTLAVLLLVGLMGCGRVPQSDDKVLVDRREYAALRHFDSEFSGGIDVFFSPRGGCTGAVVAQLDKAKESADILAYDFTSQPIEAAILRARYRGVKVEVVIDHAAVKQKTCIVPALTKAEIPVWVDTKHKIAHNKVMILDGRVVITGSFNFTDSAELHNAENLLVIESLPLARRYHENFKALQDKAYPLDDFNKKGK